MQSMKRVTLKVLAVVLWATTLLWLAAPSSYAQPGSFGNLEKIPRLGEIKELTSFSESHLAVWYSNVRKGQSPSYEAFLVIYEMRDREPAEVFRIHSSPEDLAEIDTSQYVQPHRIDCSVLRQFHRL
jgi:hypothetical protein